MMPARTPAPAMPMPESPTPKSSAANSTVWVNSVLMNAEAIDEAASRPSTLSCRGVSRSGGAHAGVRWLSGRSLVGSWPRRAIAQRIGRANSQPNHGRTNR